MARIIFDLCSGKRSWSQPYIDAGYEVLNADIIHRDHQTKEAHGDIAFLESGNIGGSVWGVLCAPPCTFFACSGNRWRASRTISDMRESIRVVDACLRIVAMLQPKWWALENPVGTLWRYIGKPKMYFNPCDYGDPYTKKTCLWGQFKIPKKNPVEPVEAPKGSHAQDIYVQQLGTQLTIKNRACIRSMTPPGFAKAFFEANQ